MTPRHVSAGKHPVRSVLFLTNPTMMLLGVLLLLLAWRVPTDIRLDVTVVSSDNLHGQPAVELLRNLRNQTVVVVAGEMRYRDFPDRAAVRFAAPERLEFSGETMQVTQVEQLANQQWRIRFEGLAWSVSLMTRPDVTTDLRLAQFDRVKMSPELLWAGGALWLLATILGWMRVFQELNA